MKRSKLIWIAVLIPIIAIVLFIGYLAVAFNKANHRMDEIASAILFDHDDRNVYPRRDEPVLNAALASRFQPGSNPLQAKEFFEKLGGTCEPQANKAIFCKLLKTANFACSSSLEISIEVGPEDSLKTIHAEESTVCL